MPFEKGQSGNPAGRPRGVPDRRQLVRDLLLPDAPRLVEKAIELALQGDTVMLRACLDKLIPTPRPQTQIEIEDPEGLSAGALGKAVLDQLCRGSLALEDGRSLMEVLSIQAKLEEQEELVKRMDALEQAHGIN